MCIRKKGCCGASLQRTCMVIGIVYLVYTLILILYLFVGYSSYSMVFSSQRSLVLVPGYFTITNLVFSAVTVLLCIFLILAAHFENEYLLIPWFIGYAATIVQIIIANYNNRLIIFLGSQEGTILDLTWSWDYIDDEPPGDFRASERTEQTSNNYNETQPAKGFEFKAYISFCNIHECFVKFVSMTNITRLTLSHNKIATILPGLANLTNLEILNLSNNQIRELPVSISSMPKLRILNVSINRLDSLPRGFGAFPLLEVLDLSYNNLNEKVLPGNFFMMETLRALYLGDNDFEYIPPGLGNLKNLQILGLRDNDLLELPREIGELTRLRELHIQNNRLQVLPPEVAQLDLLSNKSVMKMEENPWVTPIAEQYLLGISHVIEYLKTETYKIIYNRHVQGGRGGPPPPKADKSKKASRVRA